MKYLSTERRKTSRFFATLPVVTSEGILGETVNINEKGVCLKLERDIEQTQTLSLKLESPSVTLENIYLYVIWRKKIQSEKFLCGGHFLNFNKRRDLIEKIISEYHSLNHEFIKLTCDLRTFLSEFRRKCDVFDFLNKSKEKEIEFIENNKSLLFSKLDTHFKKVWQIVKNFNKNEYKLHQKYYQKMLLPLLKGPVETNRLVYDKPLGYSGDFIIINYFYDFHNKYIGTSTYAKLINFYNCNIPIAKSVVERKDFLKNLILETLNKTSVPKILNIGSGPAKELIELLNEGKIEKEIYFDCLDFEERALEYLRKEIDKIEETRKKKVRLRFFYKNILSLVKGEVEDLFKDYDLIYSAGVFDYLSSKIARKVIWELYKLLKKEGELLITNVKKEEVNHRVYYEMLSNWVLLPRSKDEMLKWANGLNAKLKFEPLSDKNSFLFLSIKKV